MIERLYIHNFKCLENFELTLKNMPSSLMIGKNGTGKSTIGAALEIFQGLGRGVNRVRDIINPRDFAHGRKDIPMRFEIEVLLDDQIYKYILVLELPENFHELRVRDEELLVSGKSVYSRTAAQVTIHADAQDREAQFSFDWHLIALPIIQGKSIAGPIRQFKTWLAQMIILAPIPALMNGISEDLALEPVKDGSNFAGWLSGLLSRYPAAYMQVDRYLRGVMPDIQDFENKEIGKSATNWAVRFEANGATLSIDFKDLSDGEKCFFVCAVVLAATKSYGPVFCFWDEPDNYLSLSEVWHFLIALRKTFRGPSQILVTSHNPEAIRAFSDENTFVLGRKSHLEPTLIRLLEELHIKESIVDAWNRGDIEL